MEILQTTTIIARAWVLEFGKDCDGCSSRSIASFPSMPEAKKYEEVCADSSDGLIYRSTEKWSDVLEYCADYAMDSSDYVIATA